MAKDNTTKSRSLLLLIAVLLASSQTGMAETVYVTVGAGATTSFDPDFVTIHRGDTVQWDWFSGKNGHSVTSGLPGFFNGLFDSTTHSEPHSFSYTFSEVGNFDYYCRPHAAMGMTGVVQVVEATDTPGTLGNISTRLRVEEGDNALIGGFIVAGSQPKKVMIRAIGPSLPFEGKLADPILELHGPESFATIMNDNWRSDQEAEVIATTIAPSSDLESAIVVTLPAKGSAYTAIVRGVNNGTGVGLVEVYDLDRTVDSKLANISTRGLVQTGDDVLIAGTIVLGTALENVLVRAIGPSLPFDGKLENPTLELRDANGVLIRGNDDWRSDQEAEIIATTIPPANDLESAVVAALPSGGASYTAIVRGAGGTTGVCVVEVYALN